VIVKFLKLNYKKYKIDKERNNYFKKFIKKENNLNGK
jgi:hypothetical protein